MNYSDTFILNVPVSEAGNNSLQITMLPIILVRYIIGDPFAILRIAGKEGTLYLPARNGPKRITLLTTCN